MVGNKILILGAVVIVILAVALLMVGGQKREEVVQIPSQQQQQPEVDYNLKSVSVEKQDGKLSSLFEALGVVPQNNEQGALGYGLILENQDNAILVSTTHAGVKDSALQKDENDPVWHNHVVVLGSDESCGDSPAVKDITFGSPGEIRVENNKVIVKNVPSQVEDVHSLTNKPLSFNLGDKVKSAVQFRLEPKFDDGQLEAVCVTDIKEVPFEVRE